MSFSKILDQEVPKKILSGAIRGNLLASAYLFYGGQGVGKWAMALDLAKAINCERNPVKACDECPSCRKIERLVHPDVKLVFPVPSSKSKGKNEKGIGSKDKEEKEIEEYKKLKIQEPYAIARFNRSVNIPVEQIRNLQRDIFLKPFEAKRKVIVIVEAEKMHPSSANSLLKILEEPPGDVNLILTTNDVNKLLPTVVSRCQQIRFGKIPADFIKERLVADHQVDQEKAFYYANICNGSYGRALDLLQGERENLRKDGMQLLIAAVQGEMMPVLQTVDYLLEKWDRNSILDIFEFLTSVFRDIRIAQEAQVCFINTDMADALLKLSKRFERQNTVERAFQAVDQIRLECQVRNASLKLGLLSLCMQIKELTKG